MHQEKISVCRGQKSLMQFCLCRQSTALAKSNFHFIWHTKENKFRIPYRKVSTVLKKEKPYGRKSMKNDSRRVYQNNTCSWLTRAIITIVLYTVFFIGTYYIISFAWQSSSSSSSKRLYLVAITTYLYNLQSFSTVNKMLHP